MKHLYSAKIEGTIGNKEKHIPLKDTYQTARKNVQRLEQLGILAKSHRRQQADIYVHIGLKNLLMPSKKK